MEQSTEILSIHLSTAAAARAAILLPKQSSLAKGPRLPQSWKGSQKPPSFSPPPWAETPSTRQVCPEHHPSWFWTSPGVLWTTCVSASLPLWKIIYSFFFYSKSPIFHFKPSASCPVAALPDKCPSPAFSQAFLPLSGPFGSIVF